MLVGCFMESIAAILILVPILMPIAIQYGIDPIHFGLIVVMNLAIGMITPPYGITLYVAAAIFERTVVQVARRMFWPWASMTSFFCWSLMCRRSGCSCPGSPGSSSRWAAVRQSSRVEAKPASSPVNRTERA